jgi:hypothetical protein
LGAISGFIIVIGSLQITKQLKTFSILQATFIFTALWWSVNRTIYSKHDLRIKF